MDFDNDFESVQKRRLFGFGDLVCQLSEHRSLCHVCVKMQVGEGESFFPSDQTLIVTKISVPRQPCFDDEMLRFIVEHVPRFHGFLRILMDCYPWFSLEPAPLVVPPRTGYRVDTTLGSKVAVYLHGVYWRDVG